jgi:ubiquinol-cytochrome c reductase cytochrome c1 subunit
MRSIPALAAATLALAAAHAAPALAQSTEAETPPALSWSFDGMFGSYDQAALQRGFQVFQNVCSACHASKYLAFRDLSALGYTPEQVKAIASGYTVQDGPNDQGEMFERPGIPSDHRPPPFPNDQASRASNNGALPPDLSLIAKAREHGADYIHAILAGYEDPPAGVTVPDGLYYNEYFPGHMIAMPPPLSDGAVTYADGTPATVPQMAADVSQFLMWLAEPRLEQRKETGVKALLFLVVLAGLLYAYKRKIWADVPH